MWRPAGLGAWTPPATDGPGASAGCVACWRGPVEPAGSAPGGPAGEGLAGTGGCAPELQGPAGCCA
eukprot:3958242-Alexandrium_andersonii.AAC.1